MAEDEGIDLGIRPETPRLGGPSRTAATGGTFWRNLTLAFLASFALCGGCCLISPLLTIDEPLPTDESLAAEAAIAFIREGYFAEHQVIPASMRVIGNRDAQRMESVVIGPTRIILEKRHLTPGDPNIVVVTGMLTTHDEGCPFVVYMRFLPEAGRYEQLDTDILCR